MKKAIIMLALLAIVPMVSSAEELSCPTGQKVESVLVSEGSPEIPATPAYDEYVFKGQWKGDYAKIGKNYIYIGHNLGAYDKVHHPATPGTPAVDPVYEDQCVDDPEYVPEEPLEPEEPSLPVEPEVKKEAPASRPGGRRHCGTDYTPSCEEWVKTLNSQISGVGGSVSPEEQIQSVLKQVLDILEKLLGSKL